jgi:hypothetical protein
MKEISDIKQYFEKHHGEILYPSDVAKALNLPYDLVERLFNELELSGKIREVRLTDYVCPVSHQRR